jgi:hypothetical protein
LQRCQARRLQRQSHQRRLHSAAAGCRGAEPGPLPGCLSERRQGPPPVPGAHRRAGPPAPPLH